MMPMQALHKNCIIWLGSNVQYWSIQDIMLLLCLYLRAQDLYMVTVEGLL